MLKYVNAKKEIAKKSLEYKAAWYHMELPKPDKRSFDSFDESSLDQKKVLTQKVLNYVLWNTLTIPDCAYQSYCDHVGTKIVTPVTISNCLIDYTVCYRHTLL